MLRTITVFSLIAALVLSLGCEQDIPASQSALPNKSEPQNEPQSHNVTSVETINDLADREAITLQVNNGKVGVQIQDGRLLVSRDGYEPVCVTEEDCTVTNFAITAWDAGRGVAFVVEAEGFDESRTYYWMTSVVRDLKSEVENESNDHMGMSFVRGRILENVEPLTILSLESHGDSIHIMLCAPEAIPDSKRTLGFFYVNDCPITSEIDLGMSRRCYLTKEAIEDISEESRHIKWQTAISKSLKSSGSNSADGS